MRSKKEEPGCDSSYYSSGCSWSEFKRNRWDKAAMTACLLLSDIYQREIGLNIMLRKGWLQTSEFRQTAVRETWQVSMQHKYEVSSLLCVIHMILNQTSRTRIWYETHAWSVYLFLHLFTLRSARSFLLKCSGFRWPLRLIDIMLQGYWPLRFVDLKLIFDCGLKTCTGQHFVVFSH